LPLLQGIVQHNLGVVGSIKNLHLHIFLVSGSERIITIHAHLTKVLRRDCRPVFMPHSLFKQFFCFLYPKDLSNI